MQGGDAGQESTGQQAAGKSAALKTDPTPRVPAPVVLVAVLVQMVRMQAVLTLAEIRPMTPTGPPLPPTAAHHTENRHSVNAYHSLSNHPADNDQERDQFLGKRNPVAMAIIVTFEAPAMPLVPALVRMTPCESSCKLCPCPPSVGEALAVLHLEFPPIRLLLKLPAPYKSATQSSTKHSTPYPWYPQPQKEVPQSSTLPSLFRPMIVRRVFCRPAVTAGWSHCSLPSGITQKLQ
jgi:hypothetical protein